ncbi:hypothetical protein G7066_12070 [Leucobacter coleopterorum]|uniref:DUF11 domain-containing protein n=1 Tax=Leucobacter coleopterorum TaxID=2714933 RepID=A0ABX6JZV5_9MICO|nr:hypothetical protein [Leucobacter coleopterorum]QIM19118.1 hypothetical protein G7066_12070 [Leucobacter coleopterorum]
MSVAAALVAGVLGVGASPAFAADATLSSLAFDVVQDGSSSNEFDNDATVEGRSWNRNDVVAANDWIQYRATAQVAAPGVVTYTSTLPVGMRWDAGASASSVCDAGGTITNASRTLSCKVTANTTGSQQVEFRAWTFENGNGEKLQPTISANGVSATASSAVTVAATVAMEFSTYRNAFSRDTVGGQDGILWTQYVDFGATRPGGDMRGLEALAEPFEFSLALPAGAVIPNNLLPSGVTVTQTGGVATFTVTGITSFVPPNSTSSTMPANFTSARRLGIPIFVPYGSELPSGEITTLQGQFSGFDPNGVSGASNFGAGYAQGQAPGDALITTNPSRNGFTFTVDRTQSVKLLAGQTHVTNLNGQRMIGSVNQSFRGSQYPVTPGQEFRTGMGVLNDTTATDAATNVFGCVAFDAQLVNLIGEPRGQSGSAAYAASDYLTGTALPANDYVVEYASLNLADNSARRAYDCGVAGDGSAQWHSTVDAAGGSGKVDAVRVKYLPSLAPSRAYGLSLPMKRTTTSASLGIADKQMIPWFWQFGSAETPAVKSNMPDSPAAAGTGRGGGIDVISALVRHRAVWSSASVQGGELATLTVSPLVIGAPMAGIDAVAKDVRIQVDLDSTCAIPVRASLDATGIPYDYTAPDFGADGIPCNADDGAPASITFRLGDINAPGGTPGGSFSAAVVGHETLLSSFSFQVEQSVLTPNGSTRTATSVISSPGDFTQASQGGASSGTDRSETPTLTVASVASFTGGKVATTAQPGKVAPGEEFQYTLNWANGTPQVIGVGRFVDVLPFNGDSRGTTGLGAPLRVSKVESQMTTPAMGSVGVEYTTDAAATVEAAVAQAGNEDGASGVTWKSLSGDTLLLGLRLCGLRRRTRCSPAMAARHRCRCSLGTLLVVASS